MGKHLAAVALAITSAAPAQHVEDLSSLLRPVRESRGVPALGVAVLVDGGLRGLGVDGVRKVGREEAVCASDLWHLGSCTKAMTATWLAMLVEEDRLQWQTTTAAGLPSLREGMHASAAAAVSSSAALSSARYSAMRSLALPSSPVA